MNFYRSILGLACLVPVSAEPPKHVGMREAVTHDQIVEASREARKATPPPVFTPAPGDDPSVVNQPKDILSRSEIFSHLGLASLVPKRAVLHIPKGLAGRMTFLPDSKFVPWRDFFQANRAWIRTVPVSRAQAEGKQPMDEAILKSFAKEPRVVIATYQEGPISVMPLRVPPTDPAPVPAGGAVIANSNPVAKP
jgi:hypothetical protein